MGKVMWAIVIGASLNAAIHVAVADAQEPTRPVQPEIAYAFDDDLVQGDTLGPDVEVLQSRRRGARDSLIRAREHFIDRLLASVEDL